VLLIDWDSPLTELKASPQRRRKSRWGTPSPMPSPTSPSQATSDRPERHDELGSSQAPGLGMWHERPRFDLSNIQRLTDAQEFSIQQSPNDITAPSSISDRSSNTDPSQASSVPQPDKGSVQNTVISPAVPSTSSSDQPSVSHPPPPTVAPREQGSNSLSPQSLPSGHPDLPQNVSQTLMPHKIFSRRLPESQPIPQGRNPFARRQATIPESQPIPQRYNPFVPGHDVIPTGTPQAGTTSTAQTGTILVSLDDHLAELITAPTRRTTRV
jgi:hypothetical protein